MADLKITQLPALGTQLQEDDPLAIADLSASETKKITAKNLIQTGVTLIDDGSIPGAKVDLTLPAGSVDTAQLADHAVTAIKLADSSSAIVQANAANPTDGVFLGQLSIYGSNQVKWWSGGSGWQPLKATGSVNEVVANNVGQPVVITAVQNDDVVTLSADLLPTTGAAEFAAGPTSGPGDVTLRPIIGDDLPNATALSKGAVSVPGNGLSVTDGAIAIDNSVTPNTDQYYLVNYDQFGLVKDGRAIQGADLPLAQTNAPGAIVIGPEFTVDVTGTLSLVNTVTPGTFPKITYNAAGLVTGGTVLAPSDIPELSADIITSGFLDPARIADETITREKLADYSIAYIQEAEPTSVDPGFNGVLWFQESTGQLRMWNGNSWMSVGFGRLSAENLRFCGTIDADTGLVTGVTPAGTTNGFLVGDPLLDGTDQLGGAYFVVDTPGAGINRASVVGVNFDAGDWVLCLSQVEGWVRIDTIGGGGGGGASTLGQLGDVTLTEPLVNGQLLVYNDATAQWVNAGSPAATPTLQEVCDEGDVTTTGATFGGNVQVGGDSLTGGNNGVVLAANGTSYLSAASGFTTINSYATGNSTPTFTLGSDGWGQFKGNVAVGETDGGFTTNASGCYLTPENGYQSYKGSGVATDHLAFYKYNVATPVARIDSDGATTLAGLLSVGDGTISNNWVVQVAKEGGGAGGGFWADTQSMSMYLNNAVGTTTVGLRGFDGSATFAGSVNAVGVVTSESGCYVTPSTVANPSNYNMLLGEVGGVEVYSVKADGAATFNSTTVNGPIAIDAGDENAAVLKNDSPSSYDVLRLQNIDPTVNSARLITGLKPDNTDAFFVDKDGSAVFSSFGTFGGNVISGNDPYVSTSNVGVRLDAAQGFIATRAPGTNQLWIGQQNDNGNPTSEIRADGSATLAADLIVGSYISGTAGSNGVCLRPAGELLINAGGTDAITVYNNSSTKSVQIYGNGAATFLGQITTGDASGSLNTDGVSLSPAGAVFIGQSNTAERSFSIYDTAASAYTVEMFGSGAASFADTVTIGTWPLRTDLHPGRLGVFSNQAANEVVYLAKSDASADAQPFLKCANTAGDQMCLIDGDGAATFAGQLTANTYNLEALSPLP